MTEFFIDLKSDLIRRLLCRDARLLVCVLSLTITAAAQTPDDYRGVYRLDAQEEAYLLIKPEGQRVTGFLFGPAQALRIRGRYATEMLELRFDEGTDTTVNYAVLDGSGDLQLSDGLFNFMIFRRTALNVDSAFNALSKSSAARSSPPSTTSASSVSAGKYADKKFLHLYTGNGYTEKWAYYLYADGRFRFRGAESYNTADASGNFSAATGSDDAGTWSVSVENGMEHLLLKWDNGTVKKMPILRNADGYVLNGTKYFLVGLSEYE